MGLLTACPAWYRLALAAMVAFAAGMAVASGGLYLHAEHARDVIDQARHAPAHPAQVSAA